MALVTRTLTNAGAPLYSPSGDLLVGASIVFWLADSSGRQTDAWDATTKERVGGDPITAVTDAQGEFSVDLWPNSRGNRSTRYKCRVQFDGFREFSGTVEDVPGDLLWVDFMLSGGTMGAQDISAISAAVASHVATPDPHTQYAKESDLGDSAALDVGTTAGTVAAGNDPRLSDARPPAGAAGGVLSGSYPNPGFAVDMATQAELDLVSSAKVDKVAGKGLSTEDYSTAEKNKLAGVATGATANATDAQLRDRATHTGAQAISTVTGLQTALDGKEAAGAATSALSAHTAATDPHPQYTTTAEAAAAAPVQSVAGKTGSVVLAKADVGLGNVDNTSDAAKPVSTAQLAALSLKVDKVAGKGLSTEDYSTAEKSKLAGVDAGANNYSHPANHPPSIITQDASNRFVTDAEKTVWNAKEPAISAGTTAQYRRGDKTWQPVADLPVSTAQAAAIATATAIHPFLLIGA